MSNEIRMTKKRPLANSIEAQQRAEAQADRIRQLGVRKGMFGQELLDAVNRQSKEEVDGLYQEMVGNTFVLIHSSDKNTQSARETLVSLLLEAAERPEGQAALQAQADLAAANLQSPEELRQLVLTQAAQLPLQFYVVVAKVWGEKKQDWLERPLPSAEKPKEDFKQTVMRNITLGRLPMDPTVLNRIDSVVCVWADELQMSRADGTARIEGNFILMSRDARVNTIKTIRHEMFHVIAGRRLRLEADEPAMPHTDSIIEKVGVGFRVDLPRKFGWLDEAVTEYLTEELFEFGPEETGPYFDYIEVMKILLKSGKQIIPEATLLGAYFENDRVEAWQSFSQAVRAAYSDGFFVKLNRVIDMNPDRAKEVVLRVNQGENFQTIIGNLNKEIKVYRKNLSGISDS